MPIKYTFPTTDLMREYLKANARYDLAVERGASYSLRADLLIAKAKLAGELSSQEYMRCRDMIEKAGH